MPPGPLGSGGQNDLGQDAAKLREHHVGVRPLDAAAVLVAGDLVEVDADPVQLRDQGGIGPSRGR